MLIDLWELPGKRRMEAVLDNLQRGISELSDTATRKCTTEYKHPMGDVAVVWGLHDDSKKIADEYRAEGKAVIITDIGFWGRPEDGFEGYYKFSVDYHHPTKFVADSSCPSDRFNKFGIPVHDKLSAGTAVLIAGVGVKTASAFGFAFESWERAAIELFPGEDIIYRAKPSSARFSALNDSRIEISTGNSLQDDLDRSRLVVTYHSNVSIDGLIRGVPCYCEDGPAKIFSGAPLPDYDTRKQFANNLAYCQWNLQEMRSGEAWNYIKENQL